MSLTLFGITITTVMAKAAYYGTKQMIDNYKREKERERRERERMKAKLDKEAKEASIPSRSIYVLGLKGAGKTSLLLKMGAKLPDTTTNGTLRIEKYQSFKIKVKGEDAIIKTGEDIGGGESFITTDKDVKESDLQRIVKTRDVILYLFDVNEFIKEGHNKEREENLARLKNIFQVASDCNKIGSIKLFATHGNSFLNSGGEINDVISRIKEMVRDYDSEPLFDKLKVIDTNNHNDVQLVKESIFS
ncbi:MAG: hypothetical protein KBT06_00505 [Prevotellaceae bacterium]|nr:hypothetical protein [Candidatus Colivivens equi]